MKQNHFAYVAGLLVAVALLFSECQQPPKPGGQIPFDPKKAWEHVIPIDLAAQFTRDYRAARAQLDADLKARPGAAQSAKDQRAAQYQPDSSSGKPGLAYYFKLTQAEKFNRDAIAVLLNQQDAQGIRIYLGKNKEGRAVFILVPVDSKGNDIITELVPESEAVAGIPGISRAQAAFRTAQGFETGQECGPPPCPPSPLAQ